MHYNDDTPDLGEFNLPYPKNPPVNNIIKSYKLDGTLIVFEGLDGSGKSTQAKMLKNYFEKQGRKASCFNFIHSDFIKVQLLKAKWQNSDPYTMTLIYTMALTQQMNQEILPKLKNNEIVILDRYINTIQTKALLSGVSPKWVSSLLSHLPFPDFTVIIDTPEEDCLARKKASQKPFSYWECGANLLGEDDYVRFNYDQSYFASLFLQYQKLVREQLYKHLKTNDLIINGKDGIDAIHNKITAFFNSKFGVPNE